jgi:hypothetical protein
VTAPKRKKAGRPRSITVEKLPKLLELVKTGAHLSVIARAMRIHPKTLTRFLDTCEKAVNKDGRGERLSKNERAFCQFCLDYWAAEAGVEQHALGIIVKGLKSEKATAREAWEFLERRFPERWAPKRIIANESATGEDGKPRKVRPFEVKLPGKLTDLSPEEVAKEIERRGLAGLVAIPPPK